jgi:small subunit ribosomal protein S4
LREKQKTKRWYGLSEKQFRRYFHEASRSKELTGLALLKSLELRLDNVVYTLGFANSRREARQLVKHNHVLLNGKRANVPSILMSKGDVIEVSESSRNQLRVQSAAQAVARRTVPTWLEVDHSVSKGTVKDFPGRDEITVPCEENMVVEFYSR